MVEKIREILSEFIVRTKYEELPERVVHQTKRCLLDFMGMAIGGSKIGLSPIIADLMFRQGGIEEATIIGDGRKLPVLNAALLNGIQGHVLDMDDGHRFANAHPGVAIMAAALAIAERENATGKQLIEAIVTGYEIFIRIARAINPSHLGRGFHTTGNVGPFGAAAACSKLLKLSPSQTADALSIAGLQGAGLLEVTASGAMIKPLHPGKGCQAGILAALLAKAGAEGPQEIFEGHKGFLNAYSDIQEGSTVIDGLGQSYEILNVYFKFHAACRHVHAPLDAVREIMNARQLNIDEIERIDVHTYQVTINLTGGIPTATTGIKAKFNLPISIGLMLVNGRAGLDIYADEKVNDPRVQKLAAKVNIHLDQEMEDEYPKRRRGRVLIQTKDDLITSEIEFAKGEPENPPSDDELKHKFYAAALIILDEEKMRSLADDIFTIEEKEIKEMMSACF